MAFNAILEYRKENKPLIEIPKRTQDTIDIDGISEEGIFRHGLVTKNTGLFSFASQKTYYFSRMYEFEDIGYATLDEIETDGKLVAWANFLNTMSVPFKWIVQNQNKDMEEFSKELLFQYKEDDYDAWREAYNLVIQDRIVHGKQGIEQKLYLLVMVEKKSFAEAHTFYGTLEKNMKGIFRRLGSNLTPCTGIKRLETLHKYYRMGKEEKFALSWEQITKIKRDFKNSICNTKLNYHDDYIEDEGKFSRVLFIKEFPKGLLDSFVRDLMDLPIKLTFTVDIVPIPKNVAVGYVSSKLMTVEQKIRKQQEKLNQKKAFSSDINYDTRTEKANLESSLGKMSNEDQQLFLIGVTIIVPGETKKQLDENTESVISTAANATVVVDTHETQQREGYNTALPIGVRQVKNLRTMLTNGVTALVPFKVQEQTDKKGNFYGVNQLSRNIISGNRKLLINPHGFTYGTSGSGKSFFNKNEMVQVYLKTNDDIIILDPKSEYGDVVSILNGVNFEISTSSKNYLSPLDVDFNELIDNELEVLGGKTDLMLGICQQASMNQLSGNQCSIVTRVVQLTYEPLIKELKKGENQKKLRQRTMKDFYAVLKEQPEEEASNLALTMERFVTGTYNLFSHPSNINLNNRVAAYGIKNLGEGLRGIGMLITLENIKAKIKENFEKGIATWLYIDEIHNLLKDAFSSAYLAKFWKECRQWMTICTGITQNIEDCLKSDDGIAMLANSEFVALLKQSPTDRGLIEKTIDISSSQLNYVINSEEGTGILKFGKNVIPFDNHLDKDSGLEKGLYDLFNTNSFEKQAV